MVTSILFDRCNNPDAFYVRQSAYSRFSYKRLAYGRNNILFKTNNVFSIA